MLRVVLNAWVTKTTAAEILANPATRRRQVTMTISLNPLRPPCSPGKPTRFPGTQKPSQFRSDSAACRGLRTEFRPFSRVLRLKSPASLSPQNSVSRTTRHTAPHDVGCVMVKIPSKNESVSSGQIIPGVVCKNPTCQNPIAFGGDTTTLPPQFEATCPRCCQTNSYRLDEIQTLQVHKKH